MKPIIHFIRSIIWIQKNIMSTSMPVKRLIINAVGILIPQRNTLSNRNVTKVFPPVRKVKYEACMNAYNGIHTALIRIKPQASSFTLFSELYSSGNIPASKKRTIPNKKLEPTENVMSFVSVSLASSSHIHDRRSLDKT